MEIIRLDIPDRLSIFQLPNTSTSKGYNLGDWKQQIWEGGLKIFETMDSKLVIRFYSRDGKQFAQLQVSSFFLQRKDSSKICLKVPEKYDEAIVKCDDSVRGYALRLNNPKGGYTWIGLGFRDRNTAFDFRSRIIDFYERSQENTEDAKKEFEKTDDLTLKQGEKISFSMGGIPHKNANSGANFEQQNLSNFDFGMPSGAGQQGTSMNNAKTNNNDWGSWDAFGGQPEKQQKQADFFGDFQDFSNFGNTQAPQKQPQQGQNQQTFGSFQQPQQNLMDEWAFGDNNNNNNNLTGQKVTNQTQVQPKIEGTTINLLDL